MPHETVDAMLVASMVVTSLQSIVARSIAPIESAVVTVGKMENRHGSVLVHVLASFAGLWVASAP